MSSLAIPLLAVLLFPNPQIGGGGLPPVWQSYTNNAQSIELSESFATMVPQIGSQGQVTYQVHTGYTLPSWLSLDGSSGHVTQIAAPAATGNWSSRIKATNAYGSSSINISGAVRADRVDFGVNANYLTYYSRAHYFPNLMTQANRWKLGSGTGAGTSDAPLLTSGSGVGYPNFALTSSPHEAWSALATSQDDTEGTSAIPYGSYRLEWDGSLQTNGSVTLAITKLDAGVNYTVDDSVPNRIDYHGVLAKAIWVKVKLGSTSDPVRNIRVWMPNTESGSAPYTSSYDATDDVIRPRLVELLQDVTHNGDLARGPIRFMDWCRVNECGVNWSVGSSFDGTRLTPEHRTQDSKPNSTSDGLPVLEPPVAYEYMIEICNRANADLWINVPHQEADDANMDYGAYCEGLADLILNGRGSFPALNSNLNVYVEWSNEVWNGGFRCKNWISAPGQANNNSVTSAAFQDFQVARMLEMYSFMKQKFVDADQEHRFRFVIMGWLNDSDYLEGLLERLDAGPTVPAPLGGTFDISTDLYGAGCSFYFRRPNNVTWNGSTTPSAMIDDIETYLGSTFTDGLEAHRVSVKGRGLRFILYEGGVSVPGLLPDAWSANWYKANKNANSVYPPYDYVDHGMYQLYRDAISILRDKQVDIACHYAFLFKLNDSAGVWQLLEHENQTPSSAYNYGFVPKLDAWIEGPLAGQ